MQFIQKKIRTEITLLTIGILCILLLGLYIASKTSVNAVHNASDAAEFLNEYGWEVSEEPSSVKTVKIPEQFTSSYEQYNLIQKSQGFDLTNYRSQTVTVYTYRLLNHPFSIENNSAVFANLLVFKGEVIAGDIVSYAANGFLTGL
jgi:ABC-type bacteriocin/lantibiotic exporter with double-glycine peptidase domain